MELKERIALARKQAGLSQEQLGEKLGVSQQAVSKWESGQNNPDVAYLAEMCRLFGVSSDWLLLGKETEPESAVSKPEIYCAAVVFSLSSSTFPPLFPPDPSSRAIPWCSVSVSRWV